MTTKPLLLSRDQFVARVFARKKGRCAFCALAAVDAHHILERKLFTDGGYYLENGVALCAAHHWACETTCVSVQEALAAIGAVQPVLPLGWAPSGLYDKWGNTLRTDGLREAGPLFNDTGCRKALAAGGFLGLFVPAGTPLLEI
jgi:hypothetical protein